MGGVFAAILASPADMIGRAAAVDEEQHGGGGVAFPLSIAVHDEAGILVALGACRPCGILP